MLVREDLIEESVQRYVKDNLATYQYDGQNVLVRDEFPSQNERAQELTISTVAIAISFDDGGRFLELGSPLTLYVHTVECWVFATAPKLGRNLANVIKHIVRHDGEVPLYDFANALKPQIDSLELERAAAARQFNSSPRPWDQNVWTCTIRLRDEVMP